MNNALAEFHYEYEAELTQLLRRRFVWWSGTWLIFWLTSLLTEAILAISTLWPGSAGNHAGDMRERALSCAGAAVCSFIVFAAWHNARTRPRARIQLLRMAFWLLLATALVRLLLGHIAGTGAGSAFGFRGVAASHLFACLFLPWTPRQALQPALPLWLTWLAIRLLFYPEILGSTLLLEAGVSGALLIPGLALAAMRISRLGKVIESRLLERYCEKYARELFDARAIHATIFPRPNLDGAIRFDYRDHCRAGIGGDFLHAHFDASGSLNLVLLDVTGDGIAAALTVNRLHGELERLFAEHSCLPPAQIIDSLNEYSYLTMAPLGIYAAAMSLRIATDGEVQWAGAGHTPAFIRRADGAAESLESTTWFLGATRQTCDENVTRSTRLQAGDALVAHTDGACDERNSNGQRMGASGVRRIVTESPAVGGLLWPEQFLRSLREFRGAGRELQQDVLVVGVEVSPDRDPEEP